MTNKEMRDAFEAWYENDAYPMECSNWFKKDEDGFYSVAHVEHCWQGWQACEANKLPSTGSYATYGVPPELMHLTKPQADEVELAIKHFLLADYYKVNLEDDEVIIQLSSLGSRMRAAIAALPQDKLENKRLRTQILCMQAAEHKFCPDCRDKVRLESCLRCQVQALNKNSESVDGKTDSTVHKDISDCQTIHKQPPVSGDDEALIERVARAINPWAFEDWQRSYDYEMKESGDETKARKFADWCNEGSHPNNHLEKVKEQAKAAINALNGHKE
jgi:hypothetical protein